MARPAYASARARPNGPRDAKTKDPAQWRGLRTFQRSASVVLAVLVALAGTILLLLAWLLPAALLLLARLVLTAALLLAGPLIALLLLTRALIGILVLI